eukprot:8350676-Alexandrium_andersonii.AAC.1
MGLKGVSKGMQGTTHVSAVCSPEGLPPPATHVSGPAASRAGKRELADFRCLNFRPHLRVLAGSRVLPVRCARLVARSPQTSNT